MLKAKDIMTREVITVSPDMEITKATKILLENRINGVPVVDEEGCRRQLAPRQILVPADDDVFGSLAVRVALGIGQDKALFLQRLPHACLADGIHTGARRGYCGQVGGGGLRGG